VKDYLKYVRSTSFISDNGNNVVDIVFLCEYDSGEAFAKSLDEVEAVMWMSLPTNNLPSQSPNLLKREYYTC
jgi:8-oxo-dGTP diphosphatase